MGHSLHTTQMKSPKELGCPNEQWLGAWCVLAHLSLAREHGEALPVAGKQTPVNPHSPALNTSQLSRKLLLAAKSSPVGWNYFSAIGGAI